MCSDQPGHGDEGDLEEKKNGDDWGRRAEKRRQGDQKYATSTGQNAPCWALPGRCALSRLATPFLLSVLLHLFHSLPLLPPPLPSLLVLQYSWPLHQTKSERSQRRRTAARASTINVIH